MKLNQNDIIQLIAEKTDIEVATVSEVLNATGNILFDYLSGATPGNSVDIKLFKGLQLHSEYIPLDKYERGAVRGKSVRKIRLKARFTTNYKNKINV